MKNQLQTSHGVYDLNFPLLWITKRHKPIFFGSVTQPYESLFESLYKAKYLGYNGPRL
jgi:REP element-mobilizing transposase RayT